VRFCTNNEFSKARNIHFAVKHITDLAFKEGNPTGIKSILNTLELCEDFVRLPLMCASTQLKNEIKIEIEENNLLH
jgi:4-hydroxy-tetrahydrodipicolinate synthase